MAKKARFTCLLGNKSSSFIERTSAWIAVDHIETNTRQPKLDGFHPDGVEKHGTDTLPPRRSGNEDSVHQQRASFNRPLQH